MTQQLLKSIWIDISKLLIGVAITLVFILLLAQLVGAEERYEVFESDQFGFTDPFPDKTIERRGNTIEVYEHNSLGTRNIFPSERIEIKKQPTLPLPRIDPNLLPQGTLILPHRERE